MTTITLTHLETSLATMRSRYNQAVGQLDLLQTDRSETWTALEQAQGDILEWQLVQQLLAKCSDYARAQLTERVKDTVTAALQAVFGTDALQFEILLKTSGGVPTAEWAVTSTFGKGVTVTANPEDANGGGIVDIVSIALRLALLELTRPKLDGPLLLDEPAKMLSKVYLPNLAEFLKSYAQKTGRRVIMVTHHAELAEVADVGYRVDQINGVSEVEQVA